MVRLEVVGDWKESKRDATFQFLYGAIGSEPGANHRTRYGTFQFLYGAIGSIPPVPRLHILIPFQFLYGAIGRLHTRRQI